MKRDSKYMGPIALAFASVTGFLALTLPIGDASAGEIAETFRRLTADPVVTRQISLRDVGFAQPIALNVRDGTRELYLPVPPNVPLTDASLVLDSNYLRAEGGRTSFIVSLDGHAVSARSMKEDTGDAGLRIGVDGSPRPNGFVRLGIQWTSFIPDDFCANEQAVGNILQILPSSHLSYRYDGSQVKDLATAWAALPSSVNLLVAGAALDKDSYDSAWRVGIALEQAGKKVAIRTLPRTGDIVDTSEIDVPRPLRILPAFAALTSGGRHTIADEQEAAALLLLSPAAVRADIVIVDKSLTENIERAVEILKTRLQPLDTEAGAALDELRKRQFDAVPSAVNEETAGTIRLGRFAGYPAIAVGSRAGSQTSGLFDRFWRQTAATRTLTVNTASRPDTGTNGLSLAAFGTEPNIVNVRERTSWNTSFDLADTGAPGQIPGSVDLDVLLAPGVSDTPPVATVYLNDYLLGAKRLAADGKAERVTARIPAYAIMPRNTLRVEFLRQEFRNGCKEKPLDFPATVLPSSRFHIKAASAADGFSTLASWLSDGGDLYVPQNWIERSPASLPGLIKTAMASGVSPQKAILTVVKSGATVKPERPFIAFDVPVEGTRRLVDVRDGRIVLTEENGAVFYDVAGLANLAVVNVASGSSQPGLEYRTVGADMLDVDAPFQWGNGTIAVIGKQGVLSRIDTGKQARFSASDEQERLSFSNPYTWLQPLPLAAAVVGGGFLLLLLRARYVRRRHQQASNQG